MRTVTNDQQTQNSNNFVQSTILPLLKNKLEAVEYNTIKDALQNFKTGLEKVIEEHDQKNRIFRISYKELATKFNLLCRQFGRNLDSFASEISTKEYIQTKTLSKIKYQYRGGLGLHAKLSGSAMSDFLLDVMENEQINGLAKAFILQSFLDNKKFNGRLSLMLAKASVKGELFHDIARQITRDSNENVSSGSLLALRQR